MMLRGVKHPLYIVAVLICALLSACSGHNKDDNSDAILFGPDVAVAEPVLSKPGERCVNARFRGDDDPVLFCRLEKGLKLRGINAFATAPGYTIGFVMGSPELELVSNDKKLALTYDEVGFFALRVPPTIGPHDLVVLENGVVAAGCSASPKGWTCGRKQQEGT